MINYLKIGLVFGSILVGAQATLAGVQSPPSADFSCVGGREACAKSRQLYILRAQAGGKECIGSAETCREYYQDRIADNAANAINRAYRANTANNGAAVSRERRLEQFVAQVSQESDIVNPSNNVKVEIGKKLCKALSLKSNESKCMSQVHAYASKQDVYRFSTELCFKFSDHENDRAEYARCLYRAAQKIGNPILLGNMNSCVERISADHGLAGCMIAKIGKYNEEKSVSAVTDEDRDRIWQASERGRNKY